ncbi:zinc finger protein 354A-like isoform X2 [Zophobas morio]|uniref:zinc finger protein 354A-like isoform X2 n=1 Tax=Zophobas morio TaxID=2755281 RepID=UPI003082FF86
MSAANILCLICNGSCVSSRNSIPIFNKETKTSLDTPLMDTVTKVLKDLTEESAHSQVMCKKCFKMFDEIDELENRLAEIKGEVVNSYTNTTTRHKNGDVQIDESETMENGIKSAEANKENELPRKILDIPSSDDDTTQVVMEKSQLQTIEDIEMELVKMHGGIENIETVKVRQKVDDGVANEGFQELTGDIIDSGAVDHSSDSDYEPPVSVENSISSKNNSDIKVKTEPPLDGGGSDRPNILRKKPSTVESLKVKEEPVHLQPMVARQDSLFTCLVCQGEETVAGDVRAITAHMKSCHDIRLYICDVCGQDFRKRNELSAHLDEHVAAEEGDFQCEVCNRIFSNLRLFRIHRRMHYPQNKAWPCETCGKKYSSRNLLEEHINTHTGVRPYVCQQCGKDFASKYTFRAHEKTHEVRPRPFACQQCPKTFLSQQNLVQHERTHSGIKEYSCHLCGKRFGSAHNLEVHSIVHTGYRPFVCEICHKAFARKAEIRDHERTHTGERPYQCEMCGATFSQRSNLQSHKRATHLDDKRYVCMDCGKGFKRRRLLDYHMKAAHTGERPFKCNVCDATFVYPEHFKKHRRIHTGEKPFLCEVCGKAFNSRDNRNAHRFVHSDKKPYECLVCGAGFMRKPLLYQHMQTQGHLNDTIVVNQPRLTTDDDQLVTVNSRGEMEIVDPMSLAEAVEGDSGVPEDSKLYISEHILQSPAEQESGEAEGLETVEHIIIDGQHIRFENEDEEMDTITGETLAESETQIIETPDGPVQLVRVRIPNENGEEEEAWIKIVPE